MHLGIRLFALIGALLMLERIWTSLADLQWQSNRTEFMDKHVFSEAILEYQDEVKINAEGKKEVESAPLFHSTPPVSKLSEMSTLTKSSPSRSKVIVAAALKQDDVSWIREFFPDWQHSIYVMNDPAAQLTVAKNKGNEGSAYLTYLITHYYHLPDHMIFIHGPRYQWHNEDMMYDHVPVLQNLRLSHVDDVGYVSLRCTWQPGCPISLKPDINKDDGLFGYEAAYAQAWTDLWPDRPVPREVGAPCCAQFAVSKAQVLRNPVQEYERIRQWLWETPMVGTKSGRIMEYMWHVLFGQDPVACPDAKLCFCHKLGHCDLDCRDEGACENRFWQPWPMNELPKNWPVEGQGQQGWPVANWWQKDTFQAQVPPPATTSAREKSD